MTEYQIGQIFLNPYPPQAAEWCNNNNAFLADYDETHTVILENPAETPEEYQERISHLKCTKRVFVLMLEQLGLDYFEQILPLIEANRQAKLEWELCVELERANPLLNQIGKKLGITPEQIDNLFRYANGEITENEFIGE